MRGRVSNTISMGGSGLWRRMVRIPDQQDRRGRAEHHLNGSAGSERQGLEQDLTGSTGSATQGLEHDLNESCCLRGRV